MTNAVLDRVEQMDCQTAMRQLWDYLDTELTEARALAMRAHLVTCGPCYGHYDFARHFLDALEAQLQAQVAPRILHARVLGALRAEGFQPQFGEV